jgi:CDP-diacylglycerol--glycerol-3-phosphate 3-phosphatidyltransferase
MAVPSATALARHLASLAPVFRAHPDQIKFLSSPSQFYESIIHGIDQAKRRISFATLYFGTEELERGLVDKLRGRLRRSDPTLPQIHVHMDYLRGTRGFPKEESSASLLLPLVEESPEHMHVSFYLTPALQGRANWRRLVVPPRWNEIFGLSHLKVCLFDDNVLVTGANLSTSYFTNRADRYILIEGHPRLANYFDDLLKVISSFSSTLIPGSDKKILKFADPKVEVSKIPSIVEEFLAHQRQMITVDWPVDESVLTFLIPTIQMAPHQIRQDERVLEELFSWCNENRADAQCALASGYFNLAPVAQHIFSQSARLGRNHPWRILTSSPEANGFFTSNGLSQYIPEVYRAIELEFLTASPPMRSRLVRNLAGEECILEYTRPNWTFHAKGVWIDDCELGPDQQDRTFIATSVGSSNFGHRSFDRDLEAQLAIVSEEPSLIERIRKEREALFDYGHMVSHSDIMEKGLPSRSIKGATYFMRSFL